MSQREADEWKARCKKVEEEQSALKIKLEEAINLKNLALEKIEILNRAVAHNTTEANEWRTRCEML